MCGIFGYVGAPVDVDAVVLTALRAMEYRGYDSWGVAHTSASGPGGVIKAVGRVPVGLTAGAAATSAIGHTRWATHGEVSERNAHPHLGCGGRIAVVHNGIIENADTLRNELRVGELASDTDTEVMAHRVARVFESHGSLAEAVQSAFLSIEGTNAFVVLDRATGEVVTITHRLPIRLCYVEGGIALASDLAALSDFGSSAIALPDDVAISLGTPGCTPESLIHWVSKAPGIAVPPRSERLDAGPGASMRSEIMEQPAVLRRIAGDVQPVVEAVALARQAERIIFTGCGSASHAALFAADHLNEAECGVEGVAVPASELLGQPRLVRPGDVVVAMTQSGETADVIDAVTIATERGAATIGFVNSPGSSVERMVDVSVPLLAGHERSVLATKSYLAMLARGMQLEETMAARKHDREDASLHSAANDIETCLACTETQQWVHALAVSLARSSSMLVLATGAHMPVAQEAALKVKEGSYVHAEAVRAGELKHGVIALVHDGFPCLITSSSRNSSSARLRIGADELHSRGAQVFWLGPGAPAWMNRGEGRHVLCIESVLAQTVITQLVALEAALLRNVNPDFPRNLAKSVTVR